MSIQQDGNHTLTSIFERAVDDAERAHEATATHGAPASVTENESSEHAMRIEVVAGTANKSRTSPHPEVPPHSPPRGGYGGHNPLPPQEGSHNPEGGASATPRLGEGGWTPYPPRASTPDNPPRKSPDDKQGFESSKYLR